MRVKKTTKSAILSLFVTLSFLSCSDDDNSVASDQPTNSVKLYASNNSDGNITIFDVTNQNTISSSTLITTSLAADGVYYSQEDDFLLQASRSDLGLEGYNQTSILSSGAVLNIDADGSDDMQSPREVAVKGSLIVVADNADVDGDATTPDGRLYIYSKSGNSITLRNTIITDFKLWGITFKGDDLYAVVDATNKLAVFTNFLNNTTNMSLSASKTIVIEGIVRTHGITYDTQSDVMILTDIGEASNAQDDGGFHFIEGFTSKFNNVSEGATLALNQQIRVSGMSTLMGNPVDVAYDSDAQIVYIAEAGNSTGQILAFNNFQSGGSISPFYNTNLVSASSVYLSK